VQHVLMLLTELPRLPQYTSMDPSSLTSPTTLLWTSLTVRPWQAPHMCARNAVPIDTCSASITRLWAYASRRSHGLTRPQTQPQHRAGRQPRVGCRTALPLKREAAARTPEQRTRGRQANTCVRAARPQC
jgi:hypothetical protein